MPVLPKMRNIASTYFHITQNWFWQVRYFSMALSELFGKEVIVEWAFADPQKTYWFLISLFILIHWILYTN